MQDVHTRLMKQNYESIPRWWFYSLLFSMMGFTILVCEIFSDQLQLRYWGVLLACALVFIFLLPEGVMMATTSSRKKTLLKEYEQSAKSSVFLDNRIGEKDDTLQEFDKAVLRLQRERQLKLKRTSKYNLSDDEEDDTTVDQPHSSDKDDFEDEVPLDDDEDADFKNGGGLASPKHLSLQSLQNSSESSLLDGEDQTHKSKKQVMMEIISKSKFYKITMATSPR
ncbi:unnamed protein product [Musa acuminata var. zebrina]